MSAKRQLVTNGVTRSAWNRFTSKSTWHRPFQLALVFTDLAAVLLATAIAVNFTSVPDAGFHLPTPPRHAEPNIDPWYYVTAWVMLPAMWMLVLWGAAAYDRRYLGLGTDEFKRVVRAFLIMVALVSFMALTLKADLSRVAVATVLASALVLLVSFRAIARAILHHLRAQGKGTQQVLLVGTYPEALEVYRVMRRSKAAGLVPVGIYVTEGVSAVRGLETPVPTFAGRDVVELAAELKADTLAVCGTSSAKPGDLRRLAWQLEGTGRDLVVAPQLTDIAGPRVHIRPVEGLPLLHVEEPTISGVSLLAKNVLDFLSSLFLLIVLSPLFAVIALAIKLDSPGPVFFRQRRVGRDGEMFRCWKFRTMYIDAEERKAALMMENETDGLLFKIKQDPRVTRVGAFLRRTSLDELPQLINVLRGEMSLVGPRPLPAEDGDFLGDVRRRLLVRPGITGLWQVSGRSDLSWDDAVRLDLYYVDNWSLTTDLQILFRTIGVVLRSKGAY
ncbi:sugar transferase [Natronoglycomyces albus]|uniref:sugar transferase n=1 Tax=Natronoglycomyces albus TaxID=2811108 RepID=UPI001FE70242|nr:sugar transferase [Natronoglycomyces albus]